MKLILSARDDGIGCRLLSMIFGIYLAKKAKSDWGFVWEAVDEDSCHFTIGLHEGNSGLKHRNIEQESQVFSREFIDKYSFTGKYGSASGDNAKIAQMILGNGRIAGEVAYANSRNPNKVLKDKGCLEAYREAWEKIDFNDDLKNGFQYIDEILKPCLPFIALHIRSGDVIYGEYGAVGDYYKGMVLEIALHIIEQEVAKNRKVIIFSDSDVIAKYLAKKYTKLGNKVFAFCEMMSSSEMNSTKEAILEIVALSKAHTIYGSYSNFSLAASCIGGSKLMNPYARISTEDIWGIIKSRINDDFIDDVYKSYSYYFLYRIGHLLNKSYKELHLLLDSAIYFNPQNSLYFFLKFALFVKAGELRKASKYFYANQDRISHKAVAQALKNPELKECGATFFKKLPTQLQGIAIHITREYSAKYAKDIQIANNAKYMRGGGANICLFAIL